MLEGGRPPLVPGTVPRPAERASDVCRHRPPRQRSTFQARRPWCQEIRGSEVRSFPPTPESPVLHDLTVVTWGQDELVGQSYWHLGDASTIPGFCERDFTTATTAKIGSADTVY